MYKCANNLAPAYLCNLFSPRISNYDLRDVNGKLLLPKPRTDFLKRRFSYSGAFLWNNLPEEVRTANSLDVFKRSVPVGLLISTPTRQICKPVIENFYLFSIVILIFLKPCINKVFIHSFILECVFFSFFFSLFFLFPFSFFVFCFSFSLFYLNSMIFLYIRNIKIIRQIVLPMTNLLTYILFALKLSKVVRHISLVGFLGLPCLVIVLLN